MQSKAMTNLVSDHPLKIGNPQWRKAVLREHLRIIASGDKSGSSLNTLGHSQIINVNPAQGNLEEARLLACDDLARYLDQSDSNEPKNAFSFPLSAESYNSLVSIIKASGLAKDVADALGGDNVIFHSPCGLYAKTIKPGSDNRLTKIDGSGFWHRDSIGSAIKIFVCLDVTGDGVNTELIQSTHTMDPFVRDWEMTRASGRLDFIDKFETIVSKTYESRITYLSLRPGQCFAFNTNAVHRGVYLSNTAGARLTFQVTATTTANAKLFDFFHNTNASSSSCKISALK